MKEKELFVCIVDVYPETANAQPLAWQENAHKKSRHAQVPPSQDRINTIVKTATLRLRTGSTTDRVPSTYKRFVLFYTPPPPSRIQLRHGPSPNTNNNNNNNNNNNTYS